MVGSELTFHDELALLCFLDDSPALRVQPGETTPGLVRRSTAQFAASCYRYRERVHDNRDRINSNSDSEHQVASLADHLYNPASFLAFGHSDAVCIVLVDDMDPMIEITAHIESPIEQTTLAFCPKANDIVKPLKLDRSVRPIFCDLRDLLNCRPEEGDDQSHLLGSCPPWEHCFQNDLPLLVVTHYAIGGLAALCTGAKLQYAVFRAMASKIAETLSVLERSARSVSPLIGEEHRREHFKCVFLDPQGAAEAVTLMLCRNYSLAISMVVAIRTLTIEDLLNVDPSLKNELTAFQLHESLAFVERTLSARTDRRPEDASLDDTLRNHVVSGTYTSLATSFSAFQDPASAKCSGLVDAYPLLDINPGHLLDVTELLPQAYELLEKEHKITLANELRYVDSHTFLVGRHDYKHAISDDVRVSQIKDTAKSDTMADGPQRVERTQRSFVDIHTFFLALRSLLDVFRRVPPGTRSEPSDRLLETGLLDVTTSLVIPFPRIHDDDGDDLILRHVDTSRHLPLIPLLRHFQMHLFHSDQDNSSGQSESATALLDIDRLRIDMARRGLPWPLRKPIEYLYQVFADCLADPFLFDSVLDLYDAFFALHRFLCLPRGVDPLAEQLREPIVTHLSRFVGALQNALMHRVYMNWPNAEVRDISVDFRGGLNKAIAGVDVCWKCGLELLHRLTFEAPAHADIRAAGDGGAGDSDTKLTVGGITQIILNPTNEVHNISWRDGFLSFMNMNAVHLSRPEEYVNYLHEAAHLLYSKISHDRSNKWSEMPCVNGQTESGRDVLVTRCSEVFADLLTHLLVFGRDTDLFLKHSLATYTSDPKARGPANWETVQSAVEVLTRAFLVSDLIDQAPEADEGFRHLPVSHSFYPGRIQGTSEGEELCEQRLQVAKERFVRVGETYGPYFSEYEKLWCGKNADAVRRYSEKQFEVIFRRTFEYVGDIWENVMHVLSHSFKGSPCWTSRQHYERRSAAIKAALERGEVVTIEADPEGFDLETFPDDALFIICNMIYWHVRFCFKELSADLGLHVSRNMKTGDAEFVGGGSGVRGWNRFQIDPVHGGLFCVDGDVRGERSRRQVTILKSLWNISTHLRGATMTRLLQKGWMDSSHASSES